MKTAILPLLSLFILFSCTPSPRTPFDREGVSFTCPRGWHIADQESIDSAGYHLSIEKDGFNSSGLMTVSWVNGFIGDENYMDIYKTELRDNIIYRNSNLDFGDTYTGKFNEYNCLITEFTASFIGLKHEGSLYIFYTGGKTIAILRQEAVEDKADNANGFKTLETSFAVL